jgi:UDP-glucose 4-epimerase
MTNLHIILGGAGFVGSNLANLLLSKGDVVVCVDNFLNPYSSFKHLSTHGEIYPIELDLSSPHSPSGLFSQLASIINRSYSEKILWHLAANSDIQSGASSPIIDLNNTFFTTFYACQFSTFFKPSKFIFASSSAVLGDKGGLPTSESNETCLPISYYGAMKSASESYLSAFAHTTRIPTFIFRFPNVIGTPATHGVLFDFISRLRLSPNSLYVKGNGYQEKPYILVSDLIDAMIHVINSSIKPLSHTLFLCNISPIDTITVREIAQIVVSTMKLDAHIYYEDSASGWLGDVPIYSLDTSLLRSSGFNKYLTSKSAVEAAVLQIINSHSK